MNLDAGSIGQERERPAALVRCTLGASAVPASI